VRGLKLSGFAEGARIETGDGKKAIGGEHVAQHFTIAGLEDMEREGGLAGKTRRWAES
jgi:hypothetical protein